MNKYWIWYTKFLAHYPVPVLIGISFLGLLSIICSLTLHELPNFSDPQAGFETRGTVISRRLTSWENLLDSVSHIGPLTTNPLEAKGIITRNNVDSQEIQEKKLERKKNRERNRRRRKNNQNIVGGSNVKRRKMRNGGIVSEDEENKSTNNSERRKREAQMVLKGTEYSSHKEIEEDEEDTDDVVIASLVSPQTGLGRQQQQIGWLCGEPMPDYAHVVFKSSKNESLFSYESIISMCSLESTRLRSPPQFKDLCETKGPASCCPGWNLGGYIGIMNNRSSCFNIRETDVKATLALLEICAPFYHSGELTGDCLVYPRPCVRVPPECITHNAVFTILHFLTDDSFMTQPKGSKPHLNYVMSFLPLGRSSATLEYFHTVEKKSLKDGKSEIVAMDLGLKDTLFDEYLVEDAVYLIVALVLISVCILIYTRSIFLTISTVMAISFALAIAYFIYVFVARIKFFPFMNILATVIAVGVGADDTFIMVKSWRTFEHYKPDPDSVDTDHMTLLVQRTLQHSVMTMFVTSLTTSAAFFASYVSSITAIKCFSFFSGLAIVCNFLLMLSWTPACLVIHHQYCKRFALQPLSSYQWIQSVTPISKFVQSIENFYTNCTKLKRTIFKSILPRCISKGKYVLIVVFGCLSIGAGLIIFYYPGLKLPDKEQFQLFTQDQLFETYDLKYKEYFGFEKDDQADISFKMPLRFVWGVLEDDNGDYLDPGDRGQVQYDPTFDVSSADAQKWLLKFCQQLRKQKFYQSTLGPLLSNCFIETFKEWMERRCRDDITQIDRAPCCRASRFPYTIPIFEKCLVKAIGDLYETPTDFWRPGVAGPKFNITTYRVEAMVIQFDSDVTFSFSYEKMNSFYRDVENWFTEVIATAPAELQGGFFVSHLGFYDVQKSLSTDTLWAVAIAATVAVVVLLAATRNPFLSLISVLTITCIIFSTVATLVCLGWKLNILESVAATLAIGLSVDFTLHYGVAYSAAAYPSTSIIESQSIDPVSKSLIQMCGPVSMAALTTLLPGFCLLPSRVLAYIQIGTFVLIVTFHSWFFSTFFFTSLLKVIRPEREWMVSTIEKVSVWMKRQRREGATDTNGDIQDEENHLTKPVFAVSETSIDHAIQNYQLTSCGPQLNEFSHSRGTSTSIVTVVVDEGIVRISAPEPSPPLPLPPPAAEIESYEMATSFSVGDDSEEEHLDEPPVSIQEEIVEVLPLAEGSATLPLMSKGQRFNTHQTNSVASCVQLDEITDSESHKIQSSNSHQKNRQSDPIPNQAETSTSTKLHYETVLVHMSDCPTIRSDCVSSNQVVVNWNAPLLKMEQQVLPENVQFKRKRGRQKSLPNNKLDDNTHVMQDIPRSSKRLATETIDIGFSQEHHAVTNGAASHSNTYIPTAPPPPPHVQIPPPVPPGFQITEISCPGNPTSNCWQYEHRRSQSCHADRKNKKRASVHDEAKQLEVEPPPPPPPVTFGGPELYTRVLPPPPLMQCDSDIVAIVEDHRHRERRRPPLPPPQPKPRTIFHTQVVPRSRSKSSSNLLGDRRSVPDPNVSNGRRYRCCNVEPRAKLDELYMFPPAQFRTSYHLHGLPVRERHPLSQSTENIFYTDDSYDPQPILPNRSPGTPDVWLPQTKVRA